MAISFPANPTLNQTYTYGNKTWQWNGTAWQTYYPISAPIGAISRIDSGTSNVAQGFVTMDPTLSALDMSTYVAASNTTPFKTAFVYYIGTA